MCWSGEASAVLAAVGIGFTLYAALRKQPLVLWVTLGYFSLMELLQAFTYTVIDNCSNQMNQILTLLGYFHIAFQPFFVNAISMYFIPEEVRNKIAFPVYTLCFVSVIVMLMQVYPFDWAGKCDLNRPLCSHEHLCSVSGSWHIAWDIPVNDIGNTFVNWGFLFDSGYSYPIVAFLLPLLYGSWRMTLYHYLAGPFFASLLASNANEKPAVWCLLSIGLLLIVVKTPLRQYLHVKGWLLWPKSCRA